MPLTVTLTFTGQNENRIRRALGMSLSRRPVFASLNGQSRRPDGDANDAEIKAFIMDSINAVVKNEEIEESRRAINTPSDVNEG